MWAIRNNVNGRLVRWEKRDAGDERVLLFEYPIGAKHYIERKLCDSPIFGIVEFKKDDADLVAFDKGEISMEEYLKRQEKTKDLNTSDN